MAAEGNRAVKRPGLDEQILNVARLKCQLCADASLHCGYSRSMNCALSSQLSNMLNKANRRLCNKQLAKSLRQCSAKFFELLPCYFLETRKAT